MLGIRIKDFQEVNKMTSNEILLSLTMEHEILSRQQSNVTIILVKMTQWSISDW